MAIFRGKIGEKGGAILTPNELVLTFGGLHRCVKFGEYRQRNATVRVTTHGQTDRQTQTDFIICPIAICYSYGADNNTYNSNINFSNCSESAYGKVVINITYHFPQARSALHRLCVHIFKPCGRPCRFLCNIL